MLTKSCECCIIGAGPAGWGTAVELIRHGAKNLLIIDKNKIVGGLARTEKFGDARFDVGPHRFFTKNREINKLWHDTLGADFRPIKRKTRIYYDKKYFGYPIGAGEALLKLGPLKAAQIIYSFLSAKLDHKEEPQTFEDWITQKFGEKLYTTFFKTYTEKVWGIPCNQIGAEWAAQRIKGLDIVQTLKKALLKGTNGNIKTLVEQFDYPVLGAGQMYEAMCEEVMTTSQADIMLDSRVVAFNRQDDRITSIDVLDPEGQTLRVTARHFFNSIPLTHFFKILEPVESESIQNAVESLYYREHVTVNLLVDGENLFPDQWIYVHSPEVKMARLANYNNFSKAMSGSKHKSALSVEYFTFQNEGVWRMANDDIKELAIDEMLYVGLLDRQAVEQAWVVRETESYPTYYLGFREPYGVLIKRLNQFENLTPIGRGGMYKYNNQDHSTLSGILAARNYLKVTDTRYNLWNINIEAEYHEGSPADRQVQD